MALFVDEAAAASGANPLRSEHAWRSLFADPSQWWDYRESKRNPNYPDFRHKLSREPLWLDNPWKPSWVDSRLTSLLSRGLHPHFNSLLRHGKLHQALHLLSSVDSCTCQSMYISLFKACNRSRSLEFARLTFSHISKRRLPLVGLFGDSLTVMLAKCGAVDEASEVFSSLPCRTVFSWTAMINAYMSLGKNKEALGMYSSMLEDGIEPNAFTYVTVLKACGNLLDIEQGKQFHRDAQEKGFDSNIFVASSLVSMYGKCGDFLQAESLFREMQHADDVAWSGMMSAYIESGQGEKALLIYRQMSEEGVNLYSIPLVFAIQACCILTEEAKWNATQYKPTKAISSIIGRALHADGRRKAVASDGFVGSTLINFYNKIKSTSEATAVFSGLIDRDVVAWTAILAAYVEDDQVEEALQLYVQMQEESVSPNRVTFLFAFQACGTLADREDAVMLNGCPIKVVSLDIGRALHFDAKNKGFTTDDVVGSSLVSMYGKCGAVSEAETAFNEICNPDIIAWTAMLSAYLQEGSERKALTFYKQMQEEQIIFTDIALANVLQACRGSGSLEVVQELHFTMISALDDGGPLFANTLVHAYAACSSLVDALAAFEAFSRADVVTWTNCITAYSLEGNCSWCSEFFHEMQLSSLKPDGVTFLSLLSAFRHGGLIDEAVEVFQSMHRVFCVSPNLKHYAVMIDLMARAGNLNGVEMFLQGMPEQADSHILNGLIGSCCTHGNVEFGKLAFGNAVNLRPMGVTAYILMSNLYASVET